MQPEISAAARRDLSAIQIYTVQEYGHNHARHYIDSLIDQFSLIAQFPKIAAAKKVGRRTIYIYTFEAHNVVYMIKKQNVLIVRILSRHQNWPDHI
jgi:toxin ParE1/3/4